MHVTTPSRCNCWASSAQSHWLSERPTRPARSQANRTRCRATAGGESPRPSGPWAVLQTRHAVGAKPIQPIAHRVAINADLLSDPTHREPIRREQDHLRAADLPCRSGRTADPMDQSGARRGSEVDDSQSSWPGHGDLSHQTDTITIPGPPTSLPMGDPLLRTCTK